MNLSVIFASLLIPVSCRSSCGREPANEPRWKDQRATQLAVGGFTVAIPAQWRDARELVKPLQPPPPADMVILYPEDPHVVGEVAVATVVVVSGDECARFAEAIGVGDVKITDTESAKFDGDPGCLMRISVKGAFGKLFVRTHGDRAVFVRCLGQSQDLDGACDAVLYGLKPGEQT